MEEQNSIKERWIRCSVIGFLIAFIVSMFVLEGEQISLINGNSYYLSSVSVFLKTIFQPIPSCIIYSIMAEIICQILFWIIEFITPKEKKITKRAIYCIIIPIVSNIISFVLAFIIIISSIHIVF